MLGGSWLTGYWEWTWELRDLQILVLGISLAISLQLIKVGLILGDKLSKNLKGGDTQKG